MLSRELAKPAEGHTSFSLFCQCIIAASFLLKCIRFSWSQVFASNTAPPSSVIPVEAPSPGNVGLSVHPDFPDDSFPLLQPLCPLQLFGGREHVHVESALKSPVPPGGEIRGVVPVRVRVAGVGRGVGRVRSLLNGWPLAVLAVSATGDLDHQGEECEEETQAHATDEEERCPLWVVCIGGQKGGMRKSVFDWYFTKNRSNI